MHLFDRTVAEVWSISVEQNNGEESDRYSESSATFKFFAANDRSSGDYLDIEAISRGSSEESSRLKTENWTEIYRFKNGKYQLLSHKDSIDLKKSPEKSPR